MFGSFDVLGKSQFYPEGTITSLDFQIKNRKLDPLTESYTTVLSFIICYPYKTAATLITCVDTDITGEVKNKACVKRTENFPGGQGAPVAVTRLEPRMFPHEDPDRIIPEFIINIQNLGDGEVVQPAQVIDACSGRPLQELNQVTLTAKLSDDTLQCRPETLRLKRGENKVVCRLEQGISKTFGTYRAPFTVNMNYGYINRMATSYSILKQPS